MPFLGDLLFELGAERVDRRKAVAPGVGAASIENRPAVDEIAGVALVGVHRRIERRAPAAVDDADGGLGIATGRHRPDHILHIGRIDVVIDDDDEAAMIVAAA